MLMVVGQSLRVLNRNPTFAHMAVDFLVDVINEIRAKGLASECDLTFIRLLAMLSSSSSRRLWPPTSKWSGHYLMCQ